MKLFTLLIVISALHFDPSITHQVTDRYIFRTPNTPPIYPYLKLVFYTDGQFEFVRDLTCYDEVAQKGTYLKQKNNIILHYEDGQTYTCKFMEDRKRLKYGNFIFIKQ